MAIRQRTPDLAQSEGLPLGGLVVLCLPPFAEGICSGSRGVGECGRLGERPATPRLHHHKLSARNVPRSAAFFRELGG
jgi:hypothetical protein